VWEREREREREKRVMDIGYSLLYMGMRCCGIGEKQRNLRWGLAIKSVSSKPKSLSRVARTSPRNAKKRNMCPLIPTRARERVYLDFGFSTVGVLDMMGSNLLGKSQIGFQSNLN